jgi:hypothetical protein
MYNICICEVSQTSILETLLMSVIFLYWLIYDYGIDILHGHFAPFIQRILAVPTVP